MSNWAGDFKSAECVVKCKKNLKIIEIILLLLIL